jgi:hypothetical protein
LGVVAWYLIWLLTEFVPDSAAMQAGLGLDPRHSMPVVITMSNWIQRMFPFLVLVALPLASVLVVTVLIAGITGRAPALVRVVTTAIVLLAVLGLLSSMLVVHTTHSAFQGALLGMKPLPRGTEN